MITGNCPAGWIMPLSAPAAGWLPGHHQILSLCLNSVTPAFLLAADRVAGMQDISRQTLFAGKEQVSAAAAAAPAVGLARQPHQPGTSLCPPVSAASCLAPAPRGNPT